MDDLNEKRKMADSGDADAMADAANYILWNDEAAPVEPEFACPRAGLF